MSLGKETVLFTLGKWTFKRYRTPKWCAEFLGEEKHWVDWWMETIGKILVEEDLGEDVKEYEPSILNNFSFNHPWKFRKIDVRADYIGYREVGFIIWGIRFTILSHTYNKKRDLLQDEQT